MKSDKKNSRKLSHFADQTLDHTLKEKKQDLKEAYIQASKDSERLKVIEEWETLIDKPILEQKVPTISKDPKTQKIYAELVEKYDALFKKLAKN